MRTVVCVFLGSILFAGTGLAADKNTHQTTTQNQGMSADMRRAIAFQRAKDRADARQAAIERRHPTVLYNQAERSAEEMPPPGRRLVPDRGPAVKK